MLAGLACALLVGNLISSRVKLRDANRDLDQLTRVDALTGLYNRRQIQHSLDEAVANADRYGHPMSVLMIDIDRFKLINDEHGHEAGDEALRLVAATVQSSLRAGDVIGRWGGEEFLAVLASTDCHAATVVAERVREAVTVSALVAAADAAMYAAKAAGRDRVRAAG